MFALPRGVGNDIDIPVASARWSSPSEVGTLVHRQADALFLGAFPHEDMWADLSKLWRGCHEIRSALDRVQDTKHRAALITELDSLWQRAVTSEVFALGHHDDSHFITIAACYGFVQLFFKQGRIRHHSEPLHLSGFSGRHRP